MQKLDRGADKNDNIRTVNRLYWSKIYDIKSNWSSSMDEFRCITGNNF